MALGPSTFLVDGWFNALCNNTSFVVAQVYVKLHIGEPGSDGTANPATETTRQAASFGAPSGAGPRTISNDASISWATIAGSQDATHFSLWDASTGGNFLGSGTITANAYSAGDTYTVGVGGLVLQLPLAA